MQTNFKSSDFNFPCELSDLGIFKVNLNAAVEIISTSLLQIVNKMVLLSIFEVMDDAKESWVVPLLHVD